MQWPDYYGQTLILLHMFKHVMVFGRLQGNQIPVQSFFIPSEVTIWHMEIMHRFCYVLCISEFLQNLVLLPTMNGSNNSNSLILRTSILTVLNNSLVKNFTTYSHHNDFLFDVTP